MRKARKFLRIVEVLQPILRPGGSQKAVDLRGTVESFVRRAGSVKDLADLVLVGDMKDNGVLKVSSVESAALLQRRLRVRAAPVITARDSNRSAVRSSLLTALSLGISNVMLAWGDRYPSSEGVKNVYDYPSLSSMIADAKETAARAGTDCRFLAPVDVSLLAAKGPSLARSRLRAGADLLLAQPPTTDAGRSLRSLDELLTVHRLKARVIPGVFPFRSPADVDRCEKLFGWSLPESLRRTASLGESALLEAARGVAGSLEPMGFAGVYVSTRGEPEVAKVLLA